VRAADGTQIGAVLTLRDDTERSATEEALRVLNETLEQRVEARTKELVDAQETLRQSQKLEAIGQLTGGVAHDFNNLLTVIRGSADILKRPDLAEEKRSRYVEAIADTADRAAKLTSQLLAFARRQSLNPVDFDAVERLEGIREMLLTVVGSRVSLSVEADPDSCHIRADSSQFETAVVNLVVNARDAMQGEGRLTIRVRPAERVPSVRGHRELRGEFVAVTVSDTGSGIPEQALDRIFDPFFTTKAVVQGTGLGLSQVFGFAKQSKGEVTVDSTEGVGTSFTLYLPRITPSAPVDAVRADDDKVAANGQGRVLVVEDHAQVGEFASQLIEDFGYKTTWVSGGQEALDLLISGTEPVDLVFSDVVMPGMSGVDLAEQVREKFPSLPIILTSGYSHVLAEEGSHGFTLIHKPYSADELARALKDALSVR
jgi:signal transduction histidine kinase